MSKRFKFQFDMVQPWTSLVCTTSLVEWLDTARWCDGLLINLATTPVLCSTSRADNSVQRHSVLAFDSSTTPEFNKCSSENEEKSPVRSPDHPHPTHCSSHCSVTRQTPGTVGCFLFFLVFSLFVRLCRQTSLWLKPDFTNCVAVGNVFTHTGNSCRSMSDNLPLSCLLCHFLSWCHALFHSCVSNWGETENSRWYFDRFSYLSSCVYFALSVVRSLEGNIQGSPKTVFPPPREYRFFSLKYRLIPMSVQYGHATTETFFLYILCSVEHLIKWQYSNTEW